MNRIFKFRARDTKKNQWIEAIPPMEYMLDSHEWDRRDCDDGSGENILFFPKNPMGPDFNGRIVYQQFLEYKDKNNKDICEGDLVKTDPTHITLRLTDNPEYTCGEIKWINAGFNICQRGVGRMKFEAYVTCDCCPCGLEVIGNIFDNPELLK